MKYIKILLMNKFIFLMVLLNIFSLKLNAEILNLYTSKLYQTINECNIQEKIKEINALKKVNRKLSMEYDCIIAIAISKHRDLEMGIQYLKNVFKDCKDSQKHYPYYLSAGIMYCDRSKFNASEILADYIIDNYPNEIGGYYLKSVLRLASSEYQSAEEYLAKAINLNNSKKCIDSYKSNKLLSSELIGVLIKKNLDEKALNTFEIITENLNNMDHIEPEILVLISTKYCARGDNKLSKIIDYVKKEYPEFSKESICFNYIAKHYDLFGNVKHCCKKS